MKINGIGRRIPEIPGNTMEAFICWPFDTPDYVTIVVPDSQQDQGLLFPSLLFNLIPPGKGNWFFLFNLLLFSLHPGLFFSFEPFCQVIGEYRSIRWIWGCEPGCPYRTCSDDRDIPPGITYRKQGSFLLKLFLG